MSESSALPGVWRKEDGEDVLDLRGLAPPEPMVAILCRIDEDGAPGRLVVRLDREPLFAYPELRERGWRWQVLAEGSNGVRLILERDG